MSKKVVINTRYQGSFNLSAKALELYAQRKGGVLRRVKRKGYTHELIDFNGVLWAPNFNDRTDADLVAVIEELGTDAASGDNCKLEIVMIPDDVAQWFVSEGDGDETVYEGWRGREIWSKAVAK